MSHRWGQIGSIAAAGALLLASTMAGCSMMKNSNGHVDCNVVKLQAQSGRTNDEIASALGVSESDIESCHASGPSDYSGMGGGAEGGGGSEGGAPAPSGGESAPGMGGGAP
jgi:hypothetical protein